jgi:hypothetical protein
MAASVTVSLRVLLILVEQLDANLKSKDDVLRKKVLIEINEDFHQADKMNFALESDILVQLISCF